MVRQLLRAENAGRVMFSGAPSHAIAAGCNRELLYRQEIEGPPLSPGTRRWPSEGAAPPALPEMLPNGLTWPRIVVLIAAERGAGGIAATSASISNQQYPLASHVVVSPRNGERTDAALARALVENDAEFVLVIAAGDLLAPGALAAAALAARTEKADAVIGLRVVFDHAGGAFVDVLSSPPGPLDPICARTAVRKFPAAFKGGDVLLSKAAIERAGGIPLTGSGEPIAELWCRLAQTGAKVAVIGRPMLLQFVDSADRAPAPEVRHLKIAALNDRGLLGGAGIAHRRLIEALRYAGHRVEVKTLAAKSPLAAAEWTEQFPEVEAEIEEGSFDFVLAGNIHGATRSASVLARINQRVPVLAVTHDLFLLTGRCAHPDDCTRIVFGCDRFCPTSTLYPQLAPSRIQEAWREKQRFLAMTAPPILIANSSWAADRARDLAPQGAAVESIDLPFPTHVFRPRDRATLRRQLDLPQGDVLVMFAAVIADAPSKGVQDLIGVLRRVAGPGVGFVAIGRIDDPDALDLPNLVAPGPITDEESLARWYGACDLYVTASRLETLGQTPIEAGLCGTPTVAYRATGLSTAVIDGLSGRLTELNPDALVEAITELIENHSMRQSLGTVGRIALENRNSHAASYLHLHRILVRRGFVAGPDQIGRIRFTPDLLGSFAGSAASHQGCRTVEPAPSTATRIIRRLKQKVWGRHLPLWMRRLSYLAFRARRAIGFT